MSGKLKLAPSGHPPVPEDIVKLSVDIDLTNCPSIDPVISKKIHQLKSADFEVPISRIITYAGMHYRDEAEDHWGIGQNRAEIQSAWQDICNWNPHAQKDGNNIKRLFFTKKKNSRRQANFTEVIAVGVGLVVAAKVYNTPYRFWKPTPGLSPYDFRAPTSKGKEIHLEVRGRFNGKGVTKAKNQVWSKFGKNSTLSHQFGVIFCPKEKPNNTVPDLILLDPESDGMKNNRLYRKQRALLEHYATYFKNQGFNDFSERLVQLSNLNDIKFKEYMSRGDVSLSTYTYKRTSFRFAGENFYATAYSGHVWPEALKPKNIEIDFTTGFFYWGIWEKVVTALIKGRINDLVAMETTEGTFLDENNIYIVLDDATAYAWAPNQRNLINLP